MTPEQELAARVPSEEVFLDAERRQFSAISIVLTWARSASSTILRLERERDEAGAREAELREALTEIRETEVRHPLEVGFNHGPLQKREWERAWGDVKQLAAYALSDRPSAAAQRVERMRVVVKKAQALADADNQENFDTLRSALAALDQPQETSHD